MTRRLTFVAGPAVGKELELDRELVVGRENADFVIADPEMSRQHAVLRPVERGIEIEDLGSLNGTFVDGRRISDPETLSSNARVKLGTTEIDVVVMVPQVPRATEQPEIARPDVTKPSAVPPMPAPDVTAPRKVPAPEPDVTAARGMPQPDVTAPRRIPEPRAPEGPDVGAPRKAPEPMEPDVTAPRKAPEPIQPDVTAPRRIPEPPAPEGPDVGAPRKAPEPMEPDVTAPRRIPERPAPEGPDVGAPRKAPEPIQPDVTAPRRIPEPMEPDVTRARAVAPQPPPAAPPAPVERDATASRGVPVQAQPAAPPEAPGAPPEAPGAPPGRRPGPPVAALVGGVLALVAIALIVVFALAARGESTEEKAFDMSGQLTQERQIQNRALSTGQIDGEPMGRARVTLDTTLGGPTDQILEGPTPLSGKITMRSDQGTLFATVQGTVTPSAGGALRSRGDVVFLGGTGNYDGAEGTATFTDNLDTSGGGRVSNVTIRGEVEL